MPYCNQMQCHVWNFLHWQQGVSTCIVNEARSMPQVTARVTSLIVTSISGLMLFEGERLISVRNILVYFRWRMQDMRFSGTLSAGLSRVSRKTGYVVSHFTISHSDISKFFHLINSGASENILSLEVMPFLPRICCIHLLWIFFCSVFAWTFTRWAQKSWPTVIGCIGHVFKKMKYDVYLWWWSLRDCQLFVEMKFEEQAFNKRLILMFIESTWTVFPLRLSWLLVCWDGNNLYF